MRNWKFVRVDRMYIRSRNPIAKLLAKEGVYLAGTEARGIFSFSPELDQSASTLGKSKRIIVRNEHLTDNHPLSGMPKSEFFPFCSVWRKTDAVTVLDRSEALQEGNYFLCFKKEWEPPEQPEEFLWTTNSKEREYRYHVELDEVQMWRTKHPAYVNLDRSSDNIGYSSWDGNLVSWFGAGFTTRLQYAVRSGLFPEE